MRVAIIGTGIAGNVAAYHLSKFHDVLVYEANNYVGGHTNTVDIETKNGKLSLDTGFIVFNDQTYPNFMRLLKDLNVDYIDSEMSFSVSREEPDIEYCGSSINGLFAQRLNLIKPSFWCLINEILRFNRQAPKFLESEDKEITLGEFVKKNKFSKFFLNHYLIPMGAAIWSSGLVNMEEMPAHFFVRFFSNHGLLRLHDRPQWKVIKGGSKEYVKKLIAPYKKNIKLNCSVESISRKNNKVFVYLENDTEEVFDAVFLACHSDEALKILSDPSQAEKDILGSICYQKNTAVLHTDESLMPKRKQAWASWNYHFSNHFSSIITMTYFMNRLQRLATNEQYFVTLNSEEVINPRNILKKISYSHPVFTYAAVQAQNRKNEIDGINRTFYCGAYWKYGFHEDGVVSALESLNNFEVMVKNA